MGGTQTPQITWDPDPKTLKAVNGTQTPRQGDWFEQNAPLHVTWDPRPEPWLPYVFTDPADAIQWLRRSAV
jgi:hypothetical protein